MKAEGPLRYHAEHPKLSRTFSYFIEAEDTAGARTMFPHDGAQKPIAVLVTKDNEPPRLEHTPIVTAKAGEPLKITTKVRDAAGVKWVRVLHRGVTQVDGTGADRPSRSECGAPARPARSDRRMGAGE